MPLDTNAYLKAQGWEGNGSGLRRGALARPVTMTQKKSLSGVGKDRDEAFPFWDHVFQAASLSIQVKLHKDSDDESGDTVSSTPAVQLERTTTGIISNRRPTTGTPALSGSVTPEPSGSSMPRLSVLAAAKREAARRTLYSRFYKGPVLGPEAEHETTTAKEDAVKKIVMKVVEDVSEVVVKKGKGKGKEKAIDDSGVVDEKSKKKRTKKTKADGANIGEETKRSSKSKDTEDGVSREKKKRRRETQATPEQDEEKARRKQEKVERRAKKAEKKAKKEEKRARKEAERLKEASLDNEFTDDSVNAESLATPDQATAVSIEAETSSGVAKKRKSKDDGESKTKKRKKPSS